MVEYAISQDLSPVDIPLVQIFLDPNNPRFAEFEARYVSDDGIIAAQERVIDLLVQNFGVDKLRMNMEINGYLPMDRVVVRSFADDRYVVLEGNRRVCSAKLIQDAADQGSQYEEEVLRSIGTIPCLLYTGGDHDAAWIFQGLRHITGISEWPAFNKAKLLVDQMASEGLNQTEVGKRFGLTSHGAGQWIRGYSAFKQAREVTDYVDVVDERSYPYFQEVFSPSSIPVREWMGWSDPDREFKNLLHLNEFVGWLYPRPKDDSGDSEETDGKGEFDKRRLARRDDIRLLANLLRAAPDFFAMFRSGVELEQAYSLAQAKKYEEQIRRDSDPIEDTFEILDACTKALVNIPLRAVKDKEIHERLRKALFGLEQAIDALK